MATGRDASSHTPLTKVRPAVAAFYEVTRRALVLALLAGLVLFGWRAWRPALATIDNLDGTTDQAKLATSELRLAAGEARAVLAVLHGKHGVGELLRSANVVTAQIGRTSNTVRLAAVEQRAQARESAEKLAAAMGSLATLVANTDSSLNGDDGALKAVAADLKKLGEALDQVGGENGLVATGTKTVASAGAMVEELRPELKAAAASLAGASAHTAGAMAHVETTTGYIEQQFAPKKVSFWLRIAEAAMGPVMSSVFSLAMPQRVTVVNKEKK